MLKKIILKKVELEGFKIYEKQVSKEFASETILVGGNAKGKSTIADAIAWGFTGKIYDGKKQIENGILNINSSKATVIIYFEDETGKERCIKRTYTEASGTSIWVDGIKSSQKALSSEIDIDLFLLNFNPCTFLSKKMQEARNLIMDMRDISSITNADILNSLSKPIQNKLRKAKINVDDIDKELTSLRKKVSLNEKQVIVLNGHIDKNNSKIETAISDKKDLLDLDKIESLSKEIDELSDKNPNLELYMKAISNKENLNDEISAIKSTSYENTTLLELTNKKSLLEVELSKAQGMVFTPANLIALESEMNYISRESNRLNKENDNLRNKINQIRRANHFIAGQQCPCCKQVVTEEAIGGIETFVNNQTKDYITTGVLNKNTIKNLSLKTQELLKNINDLKVENEKNEKEFNQNKNNKIKSLQVEISNIQKEITAENKKKKDFESNKIALIKPLKEKIESLDLKTLKEAVENHNSLIKSKKKELKDFTDINNEIKKFNKIIDTTIKNNNLLEKENKTYVKNINKLEKEINIDKDLINCIKLFNSNKVKLIEDLMKKNFNKVSLKIEEVDTEGNIKPCFKVFYDDKIIEQCSLSEQMKAGMEIVEMFRETFGIDYPMFLDNSESIIEVKTTINQIIRTVVVDIPEVASINSSILDEITNSSKDIILKNI